MIEINHDSNRVPDAGDPTRGDINGATGSGTFSGGVEAAIIVAINRLISILCTINNLLLEQYRKMADVNKQTALFSAESTIQRGKDQFNEYLAQGLGGLIGGFGTCAAIGVGFLRDPYKPQLKNLDQNIKGKENYQKAVQEELTKTRNFEINEGMERPMSRPQEDILDQQRESADQYHDHNDVQRFEQREYNIYRGPDGIEEIEMADLSFRRIEEEPLIQPEPAEHEFIQPEEENTLLQTTPSHTEILNRLEDFETQSTFIDKNGKPLQVDEKYRENAKYTDRELIASMDEYDLHTLDNILKNRMEKAIRKRDDLSKQQSSRHSAHATNAQIFSTISSNTGMIGVSFAKEREGKDEADTQVSNAASQGEQGIMHQLEKTANDAGQQVKQLIDTYAAVSNANRAPAG